MELFHLLQQFDGSHYKTLETDINLLLEQISAENLSICDLTAMCLVMGIKYAGKDNPAWREAHLAIIKFLPSSWEKSMANLIVSSLSFARHKLLSTSWVLTLTFSPLAGRTYMAYSRPILLLGAFKP